MSQGISERAARNAVVRAGWPEPEDVRVLFFVSMMAVKAFSLAEARPSFWPNWQTFDPPNKAPEPTA